MKSLITMVPRLLEILTVTTMHCHTPIGLQLNVNIVHLSGTWFRWASCAQGWHPIFLFCGWYLNVYIWDGDVVPSHLRRWRWHIIHCISVVSPISKRVLARVTMISRLLGILTVTTMHCHIPIRLQLNDNIVHLSGTWFRWATCAQGWHHIFLFRGWYLGVFTWDGDGGGHP